MISNRHRRYTIVGLIVSFVALLAFLHSVKSKTEVASDQLVDIFTALNLDQAISPGSYPAVSDKITVLADEHFGLKPEEINRGGQLYTNFSAEKKQLFSEQITAERMRLKAEESSYEFMQKGSLFVLFFLALLLAHHLRREHYQAKIQAVLDNAKKLSNQLDKTEKQTQYLREKYKTAREAYFRAAEKESDLKSRIEEADAIQREMKDFVDIQIKTNEQLMIAESKLKSLLENEQESKAILNQTLERLKDTQGQLVHSEKMASLGQLTAGIAHEINNPINFVYNGIESLKRNFADLKELLDKYEELSPETQVELFKEEVDRIKEDIDYQDVMEDLQELTADIKEGAVRTIEIVKGLRVFSRLDEENKKMADINECLEATLVLLKNKTKDRIRITKDYIDNIPEIMCYPGQLNQVFMNIINNAIQAIPDEQEDAEITVRTSLKDDGILVQLGDNGSGMSDEVKNRIFEPFFTTKPVGVGTGLGMSISFGIIEKHHGNISVESEKGKGTTFSIFLPNSINLQAVTEELSEYKVAG